MNEYDAETMKRAAILFAKSAELNARVAGMVAENTNREQRGESMAYTESDFDSVIIDCGLGHNGICAILSDGR